MGNPPAVVDVLAGYERLVEVGVGKRPDVAAELAARGRDVTATDVHEREVPENVAFVRDDVTDPEPSVYADADAVYALNCPPELHSALVAVAEAADAACLFTTLGGDQPAVPVKRRTVASGTLYVARERGESVRPGT
ncbi:UPF0146 family protein [Halobacterium noricense]|uniref:UPF0146 family protein n=1 Tax=Halobacterium noricense TaxID=223182 RepID=UPI001E5BA4BB|nr:UPF0146 family protein [Halobacterium noricense]UHH25484.1 hypothetical protein LT974_00730 [Halobacterium noricense]